MDKALRPSVHPFERDPCYSKLFRARSAGNWALRRVSVCPPLHSSRCRCTRNTPPLQQARAYSIPAGEPTTALNRFARETGLLLAGAGELTAGKDSPGLNGSCNAPHALDVLLTGSGLDWRIDGGRIALQRCTPSANATASHESADAPTEATNLPALEVQGSYLARNSTATGLNLSSRETPQSISVVTTAMMQDRRLRRYR